MGPPVAWALGVAYGREPHSAPKIRSGKIRKLTSIASADEQSDFDIRRFFVLLSFVIDLLCVSEIVFALQVVIYEALMLLKGRCQDTAVEGNDVGDSSSNSSKATALRFIEAVWNTKSLSRPKYINLPIASGPHRCWLLPWQTRSSESTSFRGNKESLLPWKPFDSVEEHCST